MVERLRGGTYQWPRKGIFPRYNPSLKPEGHTILPTACTPALIATGSEANIEHGPIDPKEAEENLFGGLSDGKRISNGVGRHHPYGTVVSAQGGGWKRNALLRWAYIRTAPTVGLGSTYTAPDGPSVVLAER